MRPVPVDGNNTRMVDRGSLLGTVAFTGVNSTTGQALSFDHDVKEIKIVPTAAFLGTPYYIVGADPDSDNDAVEVMGEQVIPVCVAASTTAFTVKSKTDTIDFGVMTLR